MKIGFDCNSLFGEKKGIGWCLFYLLENFADLSQVADEFHLFWLTQRKDKPEFPSALVKKRKITTQRVLPFPRTFSLAISQIYRNFPGCLLPPLDLVHFPNFTGFAVKGAKIVITIHDLAFKLFPETLDTKVKYFLNMFIKDSIKIADRIIAVSRSTASDLMNFFPESHGKVAVIYQGVDHQIFCPAPVEEKELFSLLGTSRYILSLSTLEPRKNIKALIKAYFTLFQNVGRGIPDLVLVGAKGWKTGKLFNEYASLPEDLKKKIRFTDYLPRKLLPKVYSGCELFVFPSLYEGFGLPVLEAMACGAPVVASKTSSIPEVGGEAVIYVDPLNPEEIAKAISKVLESSSLRDELRAKSLERAKNFSWEKTARETYALYEEVLRD